MPGKARRVAARQAQLNQRRKRQQRGPRGNPALETVEPSLDGQAAPDTGASATTTSPEPVDSLPPRLDTSPASTSPMSRPLSPSRARREQTSSANYVGAEVRRILLMGSVILVVIVVLAFVVP